MKISVDCSVCMASGACVLHAPDIFDQDEDGVVVLLVEEPSEELHEQALAAAAACPANVITIS